MVGVLFSATTHFMNALLSVVYCDMAHLESNIASILKPPLPEADIARLKELFGALEGVGLDLPTQR